MEQFDMREEKKPVRRRLLDKGWRNFNIIGCSEETKSKAGNNKYIITIQDIDTQYEEEIHVVSEPKKRWFLKSILDACGLECKDGIYNFEPPLSKNLVGKQIQGLVEWEDNTWINRDGETVTTKQHKIVEVRPYEISWDEK
jgi:hypothetical protein